MNGHPIRCSQWSRGVVLSLALGISLSPAGLTASGPVPDEKIPRIGFVSPTFRGARDDAFRRGLKEHNLIEGQNVLVEMRFAEGHPERLESLINELIQLKVDVLVVGATIGARAAKRATSTIPIVFAGSSDPIAGGIVTNLARPQGNITGFSLAYGGEFAGKWLELLKQANPDISHVAALWSSSNSAATQFVKELEAAAKVLKVRVDMHHASNLAELDEAFAAIRNSNARGLVVTPSPFAATQRKKLVEFAASQKMPAVYFAEDFVKTGGLMSYGPNIADTYRRAASYVNRILQGARPGDLPVEQPKTFELLVNVSTARALGLKIPSRIMARADKVIE